MEERELVRIDLQLPASALDSLSRLAEQLRLLTAAAGNLRQRPGQEYAENASFDTERFRSLQPEDRRKKPVEMRVDTVTDVDAAVPVRSSITEDVPSPERAGSEVADHREEAAQAAPPGSDSIPDAKTAGSGIQEELTVKDAEREITGDLEDIPTVRPEVGQDTMELPAVREEMDAEGADVPVWNAPTPENGQSGIESPLGAGVVVTAEPDMPQSRWTGITEELVTPGPAPLTAESVSLAFQRDGRRYDNGFPLY